MRCHSSVVPVLPSGLHEVPLNAAGVQSSSSTVDTDLVAFTVVQGSLADISVADGPGSLDLRRTTTGTG